MDGLGDLRRASHLGYNFLQGSPELWEGVLVASRQRPSWDHLLALQQHDGPLSPKDGLDYGAGERDEGWASQRGSQGPGELSIGCGSGWGHPIEDPLHMACFHGQGQDSSQVLDVNPGEELLARAQGAPQAQAKG